MKILSIQFQPYRVPDLDESEVRILLSEIGSRRGLVTSFDIDEGVDKIRYLNFKYATDDLNGLWVVIRREALEFSAIGPELKRSTIIVCEGKSGWDDYRLLHHFDGTKYGPNDLAR
jgi:hypothetical protein